MAWSPMMLISPSANTYKLVLSLLVRPTFGRVKMVTAVQAVYSLVPSEREEVVIEGGLMAAVQAMDILYERAELVIAGGPMAVVQAVDDHPVPGEREELVIAGGPMAAVQAVDDHPVPREREELVMAGGLMAAVQAMDNDYSVPRETAGGLMAVVQAMDNDYSVPGETARGLVQAMDNDYSVPRETAGGLMAAVQAMDNDYSVPRELVTTSPAAEGLTDTFHQAGRLQQPVKVEADKGPFMLVYCKRRAAESLFTIQLHKSLIIPSVLTIYFHDKPVLHFPSKV